MEYTREFFEWIVSYKYIHKVEKIKEAFIDQVVDQEFCYLDSLDPEELRQKIRGGSFESPIGEWDLPELLDECSVDTIQYLLGQFYDLKLLYSAFMHLKKGKV